MDKHHAPLRLIAGAAVIVAATSLTACSSSAKSSAKSAASSVVSAAKSAASSAAAGASSAASGASSALDQAAVKLVYTKFFDPKTPLAVKPAMLQDGTAFVQAIKQQGSTAYAKGSSVSVSNVTLLSPNRASVTFSIIYGGKPVVANQGGWAVKEGGIWKVSGETFCGLVSLSGTTPAACMTAKATTLPS